MSETTTIQNDDELNDRRRLELTLAVREKYIRDMTEDGKLPYGTDDRGFLLELMSSMDRTILSRKKIKVDSEDSKSRAAASNVVANLLLTLKPSAVEVGTVPVAGDGFTKAVTVEGELSTGVHTFDYDAIMAQDATDEDDLND